MTGAVSIKQWLMDNKQRILDISKKLGLSHIGSNISALEIYEEIYAKKKPQDIVIADNAHSHLSHLIVANPDMTNDEIAAIIKLHGIHCDRKAGCDAWGGSLGHGLGIGIGYALADRKRDVYVIVSDGSMMEGSNWEALRIASELNLSNMKIYCNFNGYTAVSNVNRVDTIERMRAFNKNENLWIAYRPTENGEGFEGVQGHYKKLRVWRHIGTHGLVKYEDNTH